MELSKRALEIKPSSTLEISAKAAQMKTEGIDVVTFGVGEPDFDTPKHICDAAIEAIKNGETRYTPASGTLELKQAVCKKLKNDNDIDYKPEQIIISNGAKHSLMNVFMAILNEGDEVMIPAPYWLSYSEMVKIAGGVPVIVYTQKEIAKLVGYENTELISAISIGYPDESPKQRPRKKLNEVLEWY